MDKSEVSHHATAIAAVVATVIACLALFWNRVDMKETLRLAAETLEEARTAQKIEAEVREADRKERLRQEAAAFAPYLSITQCCNQVAVSFGDDPRLEGFLSPIDPTVKDSEVIAWSKFSNSRLGLVTEVQNLGPGPAIETIVKWHPQVIKYTDGTVDRGPFKEVDMPLTPLDPEHPIEPTIAHNGEAIASSMPYTWPRMITSNGTAAITHLPQCLINDKQSRIAYVSGRIEIACEDISGKPHRFFQTFEMEPQMVNQEKEFAPPLISSHFYSLDRVDGPHPHVTAKPVIK